MDPNLNRNSMGSRAGTALRGVGAPSRLGTVGGKLIDDETAKLQQKVEHIQKEQNLYNKLESRVEELNTEVRSLEGQLADYNLALDKFRINTRPEDVKYAYNHVQAQNQKLKAELDELFLDRKKIEDDTEAIQSELTQIHQQMALRLNELDPLQRDEYQSLVSENQALATEQQQKQRVLEELYGRLTQAENRLRMDSQKLKGQLLKDQIAELESKRSNYEIQLNEANLSVPEARERILARMKEDNGLIASMEKRTKEVKKSIEMYEKKLRELDAALEDKKTEEEDKKKYEILYQKDKEMDEFLNSFDRLRQHEIGELARLEKAIAEALDQTARILEVANQLPTRDARGPAQDRSLSTAAQAKAEYELRLNNLRALEVAELRTQKEAEEMSAKIEKMREEITQKFNNVEEVKQELSRKKAQLLKEEQELEGLREKVSPLVQTADYEANIGEKKYQMHDHYAAYSAAEKKLHQLESQKYYLKHYINTKSKDMQYEDLKEECLSAMDKLNAQLLK